MKKILFFLGIIVLINLQYSMLFKDNNITDFIFLSSQNNDLIENIRQIHEKNKELKMEIRELKSSSHALENFARYNLGLVKEDETYIQVIYK
tara:strand:+ start:3655 stop:3930 length:276 start_codon:yes stop_codon:yes gene_type:complete